MLYPFKFNPVIKERTWGVEYWTLSGLEGDLTEVSNGALEDNSVNDLTEIYMDEVVGDNIYEKFGTEFPILIKTIETEDNISIQVHPNNDLAVERHNAYGKSELWYITEAQEGAVIFVGFKETVSKREYLDAVANGELVALLNVVEVKKGDVYYIPAGTVHSLGAGVELIEIQQTSDITYRIYDWNRIDEDGEPRELHTDLAEDAVILKRTEPLNLRRRVEAGEDAILVANEFFMVEYLNIDHKYDMEYKTGGAFTVLICLEGKGEIIFNKDEVEHIHAGELVLVPEALCDSSIIGELKLLKVEPN